MRKQHHLYRYFLIYFIIITTSITAVYAVILNTHDNSLFRRLFILGALFLIFVVSNAFSFYLLRKIFLSQKKYEKIELELVKYQYLESDLKLYRQHRHDMKNHLTVMYELVKSSKYEDLEEYTQQYMKKTSRKLLQVRTGSDELDVLLYNKMAQAKSSHIPVEYHCQSEIILHNHAMIDVVSIFSNLLDNAIDASRAIENPSDRVIAITIQEDELDYVFVVTNAFVSEVNPEMFLQDGFTTKKDSSNHGLGLGIINKLVNKYKGTSSIEIFNERFYQVKIELPKHLI